VPDGSITGTKIANTTITSANVANGAIGSAQIANGAITTTQLASNAVTAANIAPGTITATQLAKPPQSGSINSSSLVIDFDRANFSVTFSPAFNSTPNVSLSVETASTDLAGNAVVSLNSKSTTGFSASFNAHTKTQATPETAGNVGQFVSMAIVNGDPAMSYYDTTNNRLRYVRATDVNGAVWGSPVPASSSRGLYTSLAVVNGNPAISFQDNNGRLGYVRATDVNGAAWSAAIEPDSASLSSVGTSLLVVNGNPAISYNANGPLKFLRATDVNGAAWPPRSHWMVPLAAVLTH